MSTDRAYKQAIKRVCRGRDDDRIHVIASRTHYVHKIANENEDTLELASIGDRIIVAFDR
jgi:hypothetical protein